MLEFHKNFKKYFEINRENTLKHIMPFIQKHKKLEAGMRVMEIGCGEGGVLESFLAAGMQGVGVELDATRLTSAEKWLAEYIETGKLILVSKNIYDADIEEDLGGKFDLIILKDVIEHIYDQEKLMAFMQDMLLPGGVIFFGFPPWQMPWGGHQQILKNKWLAKIPYYHLLPMPVYLPIIRMAKENVQEMKEIKETGISIERFEKIVKKTGYVVANKQHYLINPIYQYKFGWKPRKQNKIVQSIPWVRNFLTSCVYYLIEKK